MIRIGSEVRCKYQFIIEDYELPCLYLSILGLKGSIGKWIIPAYIGNLGLHLPEFDYCTPGEYNESTHPDYYEYVGDSFKGLVWHDGRKYRLHVAPDFNNTGRYLLIPQVYKGGNYKPQTITKYARKRTRYEVGEILDGMISQTMDGSIISGYCMSIIIRHSDASTPPSLGDRGIPRFVNQIDENYHFENVVPTAVIQDMHTYIEYEFPIKFLEQK